MIDNGKNEVVSFVDGIVEIRMRSWGEYMDYLYKEMMNYESYIWRGHRCSTWQLESTLDRMIRTSDLANTKHYDFRSKHLEQFIYASRGRRGSNPPPMVKENDWWAIGQHHGLATPLLDWTKSPFVAAYFAFIETGKDQTTERAIFALHRDSVENKLKELMTIESVENANYREEYEQGKHPMGLKTYWMLEREIRPQIEFIRPLSDENQRLINQGGLFTRAPDGIGLEAWVKNNFKSLEEYILIKILVPNSDRKDCLRMLNRMNINHLTLFPDIGGASIFCNLFSEIENY